MPKRYSTRGWRHYFCRSGRSLRRFERGDEFHSRPLFAWHDFEVAARTQYAKPIVVEERYEWG